MKSYTIRRACMRATSLPIAAIGMWLASSISHAQANDSSPLENVPARIATVTGIESGVITPSPPEISNANRASAADRNTVVDASSNRFSSPIAARITARSIDEWKSASVWPTAAVTAGSVAYEKVAGVALFEKRGLDKPLHVAQELAAAKLNVALGVASNCILETINAADAWLEKHPVGTFPTWDEYQVGNEYWWALYRFNNEVSSCM